MLDQHILPRMGAFPTSDMPGHQRLHERVVAALDRCQETRDVDFKESASWGQLKPRIIKTALAMANLRDGGIVVIGASERGPTWDLSGITQAHLNSYDVDDVIAAIDAHASPHVDVDVVLVNHLNGNHFLAIQIHEFDESPVVCKRAMGDDLRVGDVIVRPAGQPRSTRLTDAHQMHELLELAAEKRARRLFGTARRVGLEPTPTTEQKYRDELDRAGALRVQKVTEVPRWRVIIRPEDYEAERIASISQAWQIIEQCHVRWAGWSYPVVLRPEEYRGAGSNWVTGWFDAPDRPEEWRLFLSGQFFHERAICSAMPGQDRDRHEEWTREHLDYRADVPWDIIRGYVGIHATVRLLTEVFEFAARLCERGVMGPRCMVELAMLDIQNTALTTDSRRSWHELCLAATNQLDHQWMFEAEALSADRVTPVIDTAIWFFERFGWHEPSREIIDQDVQAFRAGR